MSAYEDTLLGARFAALAPEPLPGDWNDVLGRAGVAREGRRGLRRPSLVASRRRRLLVVAAAIVVLALASASAYGVRAILTGTGIVGLAPVGATPSSPRSGELVLEFIFGHSLGDPGRFSVTVYADGRLLSERIGDYRYAPTHELRNSTGLLERRLTPEGVELVKAAVISTGLVDRDLHLYGGDGLYSGLLDFRDGDRRVHVTWGDIGGPYRDVPRENATPAQASALKDLDERLQDPLGWLPASAWKNPTPTPFVPWGYSVCYYGAQAGGLSEVLALLPAAAEDLLRSRETRRNQAPAFVYWCSDLTSEEARTLARILDAAGVAGHEDVFGMTYGAYQREPVGPKEFTLSFTPLFPDEAEGGGVR